ncbi:CYFA0S26e00870g1_1 [Cyberlindnera fabianii]|uniref:Cytochrome c oxidase assembly protein COX16, mitochondrial n=1 Tax=Cyberlindnera fabianii TaxID=36022 RepID=A0A061BG42_CYBFA|nr:CYFA0S26e00870g1_1 [Cyberlindnera fabianii]
MVFNNKKFRSKREQAIYDATMAGKYQKNLKKHPFLLFGLPFLTAMGLASVWLSSFTAVRYENRDRKTQELGEEEILKLNTKKRSVDVKEEYYRLQGLGEDDWEPKRVPRLPGESDNVF